MLMRVSDLAILLKMNPQTIYRLVREGAIPFVKIGGSIRFESEEINKWILNSSMKSSSRRIVNG